MTHFNTWFGNYSANQFADQGNGNGLILHLAADEGEESKDGDLPKYIPTRGFSAFPQERELLFYGERCKFQIRNIYEGHVAKNKSHRTELSALNVFQKMLENGKIEWKRFQNELSVIREYMQVVVTKYVNACPLLIYLQIGALHFHDVLSVVSPKAKCSAASA